jgi:diadenosine tetraphosphate (Ap4A) HIT family hydrolase
VACELCDGPGGELLLEGPGSPAMWRAVLVDDADYPGFCRVIAGRHAREMTDLPQVEQRAVVDAVLALELAVREVVRPDKVNVASLGNVVPHVHWHVIPRWADDRCFPSPIWAPPRREAPARPRPTDLAARLRDALARAVARPGGDA